MFKKKTTILNVHIPGKFENLPCKITKEILQSSLGTIDPHVTASIKNNLNLK